MKKIVFVIATLLFLSASIAYFTKPGDTEIINKAIYLPVHDSVLDKELYYNLYLTGESSTTAINKGLSTEDKILYKVVSLQVGHNRQIIGKAYLGKFHYSGWRNDYLNSFPYSEILNVAARDQGTESN